jgi:glucosyl-3-phosphoglycerate synthase
VNAVPTTPRPPYRWADWTAEELLRAKARRGTRVSLVLPARDEAATVGDIVARVRRALVDDLPLVDEIVVVDSDSSDATAEVARSAGATVLAASAIRPDLGTRAGKGEAMWKALFATTGDVLVFMDADLTEWDTHFVTGLLGPLLTEDDVELVKGFYDRPVGTGTGDVSDGGPAEGGSTGGGRVTELVARPLIALHWPELSGIVQPLAGEWAVRRSLFERLTVPTGYAVELGVLLDTHEIAGPGAIAQVDLGVRRHGHQPLRDLGAMALELLALAQVRQTGKPGAEQLPLRQYDSSGGIAVPVVREVDLRERPPAVSVPGYVGRDPRRGAPQRATPC